METPILSDSLTEIFPKSLRDMSGNSASRASWIPVECNFRKLSNEAIAWIKDGSSDLCMMKAGYRKFQTTIPTLAGVILDHYEVECHPYIIASFYRSGRDLNEPLVINRSVDAVLFVSNKDAVYFKMRFL